MAVDKHIPVDMILVEATAIDGEHFEAGTVLKKMDSELALDLAGSSKARPSTPELIAEFKERAKHKEAAAKAKAEADQLAAANMAGGADALASVIAAAIAKALETKPANA
jgi:hypothetical protein